MMNVDVLSGYKPVPSNFQDVVVPTVSSEDNLSLLTQDNEEQESSFRNIVALRDSDTSASSSRKSSFFW